ncbi:ABC transporter ATP-binding protein, partial [Patescibacteria group bacterium]|nr:ABC transporter ATP-binding protein [Patescibacteria group bacterium]
MTFISVKKLTKVYKTEDVETPVLHGLDFEIKKGEFISIMGPSGSGKSTLMHILGFLDTPTSGKYTFEKKDVSKLSDDELAEMRSLKVGFVFQSFNLLPRATALENVALPLLYVRSGSNKRTLRAKQLLESVGLGHRLDFTPGQLSGGEKQRVAIARALVNEPDVIFADEPTVNLDSKSGHQVMETADQSKIPASIFFYVYIDTVPYYYFKKSVRRRGKEESLPGRIKGGTLLWSKVATELDRSR